MDSLLSVNPGLIIWTIINFLIFLLIILKFGSKPIMNALKSRENRINSAIESAEKAKTEAEKLFIESEKRIQTSKEEMSQIVAKGRQAAEDIIKKASEEADLQKKAKLDDAIGEIEKSKNIALIELRKEVAQMAVEAAEKIIDANLDKEKHYQLVEKYIEKIPKN
ncbi:MAG: F0F1 ATP synthase subunit B [Ignavibacteria bacterium]|nr:F0F1 ATP synthase subunit B [Ignavibacteria bacterium]